MSNTLVNVSSAGIPSIDYAVDIKETDWDRVMDVNVICPGIVETDMKRNERVIGGELRGLGAAAVEQEDVSQVPLGRTATLG